MDSPIINTTSLDIWYGNVHAVKNVNLQIPRNKVTALIGASGSGKTTYLRCLNRMLDGIPNLRMSGTAKFGDTDILSPSTDVVLLRRDIGMVFQNPTPFPKSVYDNIAYGLEIQGMKRSRWGAMFGKRKRLRGEDVERSDDPLDQAVVRSLKEATLWDEVKDRLGHSAYRLSGGQQQRLCIARSIAVKPQVLLLDEPCSALDPISIRHIEELLIVLKQNYTIVIVTHNMHQARRVADRVCFFHAGELVEVGSTDAIFSEPSKPLTKEYVMGAFG